MGWAAWANGADEAALVPVERLGDDLLAGKDAAEALEQVVWDAAAADDV